MPSRIPRVVTRLSSRFSGSVAVIGTATLAVLGILLYIAFVMDQIQGIHQDVLDQARSNAADLSRTAEMLETDFRGEVSGGGFDAILDQDPDLVLSVPDRARRFYVRHQDVIRHIIVTAPGGAPVVVSRSDTGHFSTRRQNPREGVAGAEVGVWLINAVGGRRQIRATAAIDVGALMAESVARPSAGSRTLSALIDGDGVATALVEARGASATHDIDLGLGAEKRNLAQRLEFTTTNRIRLGTARWRAITAVCPASVMDRPVWVICTVDRGRALQQLWSGSLLLLAVFVALGIYATLMMQRLLARRDKAERALSDSRRQLELALRGADIGVWDLDLRTGRLLLDHRWSAILGFDPGEMPSERKGLAELMEPEDRPAVESALMKHIEGDSPGFEAEFRARAKDGSFRWIQCRGGVVERNNQGKAVRVAGTNRDYTVQHADREARRRSEARKTAILDATFSAVITVRDDGRLEDLNAAARTMFGCTTETARERGIWGLISLAEAADGPMPPPRFLEHMAGGRFEGWARGQYGGFTPVEVSVARLNDEESGALAVFVQDIALRRAAEKALRETATSLEATRNRDLFIGAGIQKAFLVGAAPTDLAGFSLAAVALPSEAVGGDYLDFFWHSPTMVDVIVGDVMGKGLPAALLGAAAKGHFARAVAKLSQDLRVHNRLAAPEEVVAATHTALTPALIELEWFVTLCFARIDVTAMTVTVVDCGHPAMLQYCAASGECRCLTGENTPLGFIEREVYRQHTHPIALGDILVAVSDGVIETRGRDGDLFGMERLADLLASCSGLSAEGVVTRVREAVREFSGSDLLVDDLTCVAAVVDPERVLSLVAFETVEVSADDEGIGQADGFVDQFVSTHMPAMPRADVEALCLAACTAVREVVRRPAGGMDPATSVSEAATTLAVEVSVFSDRARVRITDRGGSMDRRAIELGNPTIRLSVDGKSLDHDELGRNQLTLEKWLSPEAQG
ncbi:MAG: SpoIIE family protein phosphatase [Armatimonadetes bacterium]|nr:SpoIIE family protein phosphatase [Armatimonadota bacterium]